MLATLLDSLLCKLDMNQSLHPMRMRLARGVRGGVGGSVAASVEGQERGDKEGM
jgi:hypothetical protein